MKKLLLFCMTIFFAVVAKPSIEVGGGLSSVTSGRYIPGIAAAFVGQEWMFSATSIGYQSNIYYGSTYSLSVLRRWDPGELFWGRVTAGIGLGIGYGQRGYKAGVSGPASNANDFNFGPALRVNWFVVSPIYLCVETVFGLGSAFFSLSGQDVTMLSLGINL